jgi:integrase
MIAGIAVLTALVDFYTSAQVLTVAMFILPLLMCITQRSKWLLWITASLGFLQGAAAGVWGFHQITSPNPWVASANRALFMAGLLALTMVIHLWMNKSQKAILGIAKMERYSISLTARNEQLEADLLKIKAAAKGKQKPIILTIKQYQAFAGQLSDLHRTMVVTAMCTGMRVSEVLSLRWDQFDFANGLIAVPKNVMNTRIIETEGSGRQLPMDPVLVETLLEWRNKTSATGLLFPSHITGRCYHPGPIQQDYFKPAARKLGLVGVCWQTFPNSYRNWHDDDGTSAGVQQRLMRHASKAPTPTNRQAESSHNKPKGKANGKVIRQALPKAEPSAGVAADAN